MMKPGDELILQLLKRAPFARRGSGWRFGAKTISSPVVERLIASRKARIEGNLLVPIIEGLTTVCFSPEPEDQGWLVEYTASGPSDAEFLVPDFEFAARRQRHRDRMRALRASHREAAE